MVPEDLRDKSATAGKADRGYVTAIGAIADRISEGAQRARAAYKKCATRQR